MPDKTAIVIGATGAVGQQLVQQLLHSKSYQKVICFGRKRLPGIFVNTKVEQHIIDFEEPKAWQDKVCGDSLFICLGTTLKKAGSKSSMITIDHHYPVLVAQIAKNNGVRRLAFISSIGAKTPNRSFYLDLKGKVEHSLIQLEFDHTLILRPSVLIGHRDEFRPAEWLGIHLLKALQFLPFVNRYKPITTNRVAQQMMNCLTAQTQTLIIMENDDLHQY